MFKEEKMPTIMKKEGNYKQFPTVASQLYKYINVHLQNCMCT